MMEDTGPVGIVVMAKAPAVGRSKTRMVPPLTEGQAAELAAVALDETLTAVRRTPGVRRLLAVDGNLHDSRARGFTVIRQRGETLADRLAAALEDADPPALAISADTPQVTPELLSEAASELTRPGVDAVIGPCPDGGYWAIGLRRRHPDAFLGVPMSRPNTLDRQWCRLVELGLSVEVLPSLRDADYFDDALAIAEEIPGSRFGAAVRRFHGIHNGEETA